jgi:hypothetical protein
MISNPFHFQLDAVNWRLCLQMAQKTKAEIKQPIALLELKISDSAKCVRTRKPFEYFSVITQCQMI